MREFNDSAPRNETVDLAFPDWSGMDDSTDRVTPDAAFQLCEQYRALWPQLAEKWRQQRPEKCLVEFVL